MSTSNPSAEDSEQSKDHLLSVTKAHPEETRSSKAVHCPACGRPVPGMYLVGGEFRQCPECGHRRED